MKVKVTLFLNNITTQHLISAWFLTCDVTIINFTKNIVFKGLGFFSKAIHLLKLYIYVALLKINLQYEN